MSYLHLFWDGVAAPSGWTIVSDLVGDFYQKMIRGNSTYGGTGGGNTHTHTTAIFSFSGPSDIVTNFGSAFQISGSTESHKITLE